MPAARRLGLVGHQRVQQPSEPDCLVAQLADEVITGVAAYPVKTRYSTASTVEAFGEVGGRAGTL